MEKQRIVSLDVFRGATMVLMILVNNPGSWDNVYAPLLHADWHGCTPTDLVFPFFVFAMGMAMPFANEEPFSKTLLLKILTRSLRIISLGLFLNFFSLITWEGAGGIPLLLVRMLVTVAVGYILLGKFSPQFKLWSAVALLSIMLGLAFSGMEHFANVRIPGVLQRLGLVYFFAALIHYLLPFKSQFGFSAILLLGYYLLLAFVPTPGTGIVGFEKGANIAAWVDAQVLGNHVWSSSKPWDPEGVLSTLPAIVSCLMGVWAGRLFKQGSGFNVLLPVGIGFLLCGLIWAQYFPLNKPLWSSSYVLYTSGLALLICTLFSFFLDGKKSNPISTFFTMWGVNPIFVFFGAGIIPRAINMISINDKPVLTALYKDVLSPMFSEPKMASLSFAILNVLFWTLVLLFLKRKSIVVKV